VKPPPFAYRAPASVDEALADLADLGDDGKVLAGGQSLIPLLNMRLASPAALVDINTVASLDGVRVTTGSVEVGATVRHSALEHHAAAAAACPLLRQALRLVAHPVVRNRGTVCGSIAHADSAGELTAVLAVLGGTVRVARAGAAAREVPADAFFVGAFETTLEPADLVTAVTFPRMSDRSGSAFVELARRHGDYALCGVAAVVELAGDGSIASARTGAISVHPTPLVVDCSEVLAGRAPDDAALAEAAELVYVSSSPSADLHATVAYRRHLTRVLTTRALTAAVAHARTRGEGERQRAGGRGPQGEGERQRAGGRGPQGEGERQRAGGRGPEEAAG
jgi:carbon-monoxide dehydrogenase medium subunit